MTTTVSMYDEVAIQVRKVISDLLGENSTVDTQKGQGEKVFVVAVSPLFNGKTQRRRQDMVWKPVKKALGRNAQQISLIMTYGTDELL